MPHSSVKMFVLVSRALQPGRAETASQSTHAVTQVLLQTAKAGVSHQQELGRQTALTQAEREAENL